MNDAFFCLHGKAQKRNKCYCIIDEWIDKKKIDKTANYSLCYVFFLYEGKLRKAINCEMNLCSMHLHAMGVAPSKLQ